MILKLLFIYFSLCFLVLVLLTTGVTNMQVFMKAGHPVPPVATTWRLHRDVVAADWDSPYIDRIQNFLNVIGCGVATTDTCDTVDID